MSRNSLPRPRRERGVNRHGTAGTAASVRGETLLVPHFYQCWSLQSGLSRQVARAVVATAKTCLTPGTSRRAGSNPKPVPDAPFRPGHP